MDRISSQSDLTAQEMTPLRLMVTRSFVSKGSLPAARCATHVQLGLIQNGMGGVMPTPAGCMVARLRL